MVESVDTEDLKSSETCRLVPVQVWLSPFSKAYVIPYRDMVELVVGRLLAPGLKIL